jgi:dihydrofolate reductase
MTKLSLIAAVATNGVIGVANELPWHLSSDLMFFKRVTMGKPIIMGRLTYDSIGRPLPKRPNIVVTSQRDWCAPGVEVCHSVDDAITLASDLASSGGAEEVLIIGGEQIYRLAMPRITRLYLTRVQDSPRGDAFFPDYDAQLWCEKLLGKVNAQGDIPAYHFVMLDKRL